MNPKDHAVNNVRPHSHQPPQRAGVAVGADSNPYTLAAMAQRGGINGLHVPVVGDMRQMAGAVHPGAARGFATPSGLPGISFDGLPTAPVDGAHNTVVMPGGAGGGGGWVRTAAGMEKKGVDNAVAWLDHSRQQQQQQQGQQSQQQQPQQQQQGQHPGSLAPGLMYASKAALHAANMENST